MNVLFVCTGNTCRSPMAQGLFNALAEKKGIAAAAASCGVAARDGDKATVNAVLAAAKQGADIASHRARQVSADICQNADWIFCMSPSHRRFLIENGLAPSEKVFVLSPPVPDPFGQSLSAYGQTAGRLLEAASEILEMIAQGGTA